MTFDPCRSVRWVLRPDGAPAGADRLVHAAVARVGRAAGLQFVFAGNTDEARTADRPSVQPARYGPGPAPLLVAWSTAQESPELAGARVALGVASWPASRAGCAAARCCSTPPGSPASTASPRRW